MKTPEEYESLLEDRPVKFTAADVDFRKADDWRTRCARCLHYYERKLDRFGVCEIFRSEETDESGVDPDGTCDFFTVDGNEFPLRDK